MLLKVQDGEIPERPPDGIADPVWEFLERCWSRDPAKRPSTAQVYESLSNLRPLPAKLSLRVHGIKTSLKKSKQQRFAVRFKYGNKSYTTSATMKVVAGDEYTWFGFRPFLPVKVDAKPWTGAVRKRG